MNIIQSFNRTIDYIEKCLDTKVDEKEIMSLSRYSYPLFSRIFSMLVGYPLTEYIRFRKLSLAAAFKKFHGASPTEVRNVKEFKSFSPVKLSLTIIEGQSMDIKIEKKKAFAIVGLSVQSDQTTDFPKVWDDLFNKVSHNELISMGNGQSYGACYNVKDCNSFNYMAGYDCTDKEKAEALGLSVMQILEAEYAVVQLKGPVPDCIHQGWKYVMNTFLPKQGYRHAGTPDFEVYKEGNMYDKNYNMELWVPIIKE